MTVPTGVNRSSSAILRSTPNPTAMIRCKLSNMMRLRKLSVAELARATQLNRSTITALCKGSATRIELPAIEALCRFLGCGVGDLFEVVADHDELRGGWR